MDQAPRVPRAPRFAIPLWMLYRAAGESGWRAGRTENISRTGVLFTAEQLIERDSAIEMLLAMPSAVAGDRAGTAMCRGRIVRAVAPANAGERPGLAAAILNWLPVSLPDPRRI